MKFPVKVPPSTTETTVIVDIPEATAIIKQEAPVFSQSGGTPPVTTPPVDPPPATVGLTSYGTILSYNKFDILSPEQLGKGKVIADPRDPNNKVFSAIVDKGDAQQHSGWRAEQNWPSTPTEGGVEFDISFVTTYQNSLILQIHGNTPGTGGPVSIQMDGLNKLKVVLSDEKMNNQYFPISGFTIVPNKWYHFRVEFLLANPGYFRVYIDKALAVNVANKKVNDITGQYGKIGINLFGDDSKPSPGSMNVLYDNFYVFKK